MSLLDRYEKSPFMGKKPVGMIPRVNGSVEVYFKEQENVTCCEKCGSDDIENMSNKRTFSDVPYNGMCVILFVEINKVYCKKCKEYTLSPLRYPDGEMIPDDQRVTKRMLAWLKEKDDSDEIGEK